MLLDTTDRSACDMQIRHALMFRSHSSTLEEELLAALVDSCEENISTTKLGTRRHELCVGRWVILDGDLDLFKVVKDAVLALAPAHFLFSSLTAAGIASLVFSLLQAVRNAYRGGVVLTPEQVQLLLVLKAQNQPVNPADLSAILPAVNGTNWTPERVHKELGTLSAFPTRGGAAALVKVNGNGEWFPNGF